MILKLYFFEEGFWCCIFCCRMYVSWKVFIYVDNVVFRLFDIRYFLVIFFWLVGGILVIYYLERCVKSLVVEIWNFLFLWVGNKYVIGNLEEVIGFRRDNIGLEF